MATQKSKAPQTKSVHGFGAQAFGGEATVPAAKEGSQ